MKYVIIEKMGAEVPILFPDFINHHTFKYMNPISAGFCSIDVVLDGLLDYEVHGESASLKLKSRPEDADIIKHAFEFQVT